MANEKKFLDAEGLKHLWSRISMEDYPNNSTLMAVIDAIDETKVDKIDGKDLSTNDFTDELKEALDELKNNIGEGESARQYGIDAIATGKASSAQGQGVIAIGDNSHVQGKYNIKDIDNIYANIVGNGDGPEDNQRSNAYTLDWDGNGWFAGDIIIHDKDGKSYNVSDAFINPSGVGKDIGNNSEIFNDYTRNETNIPFAHIEGKNNKAIIKSYSILYKPVEGTNTVEIAGGGGYTEEWDKELGQYVSHFVTDINMGDVWNIFMLDKKGDVIKYRGNIEGAAYQPGSDTTILTLGGDSIPDDICSLNDDTFINTLIINGGSIGSNIAPQDMVNAGFSIHMEGSNNTGFFNSHVEGTGNKALGYASDAGGYQTTALGERAFTRGYKTKATGHESLAMGAGAKATGYAANAMGHSTTSSGTASSAEGSNTVASGGNAHSQGQNTTASGQSSFAGGQNTVASGIASEATGIYSTAVGKGACAKGNNTKANGTYCFTMGDASEAYNNASAAFGLGTKAGSSYQFAHGKYNKTDWANTYSHIVGNGTNNSNRSNAYTLDWEGNGWFSNTISSGSNGEKTLVQTPTNKTWVLSGKQFENVANFAYEKITTALGNVGINEGIPVSISLNTGAFAKGAVSLGAKSSAAGSRAVAEGSGTFALGNNDHAEGCETFTMGGSAHAEGYQTAAIGQTAHAEGSGTLAIGWQSHAEGENTQAIGQSSHAEGASTVSNGQYSHTEGANTVAIGYSAHAEGAHTNAQGSYSHAEGNQTKALKYHSHAEGYYTQAGGVSYGDASHAEGYQTNAYADASHTEGKDTQVDPTAMGGHAEGIATIVKDGATAGHAEGKDTRVLGVQGHAEGAHSMAIANYSHAEGYRTVAGFSNGDPDNEDPEIGQYSHAEGYCTVAAGNAQHVSGKYNFVDPAGDYAVIVGNGTSDFNRSNAYTLDWYGNGWFAGSVETSNGFILSSPNGTRYQIKIDDNGNLSTTKVF